ncbi:MFS transporter [Bacillus kwashiorkori]|uniref:MFS transporter n=1 Tax=Bacillus kwashiorkori TaxID=1522318 RepID=UPI0008F89E41|nr:MFS transporter [Bacillus kwashiorkori]
MGKQRNLFSGVFLVFTGMIVACNIYSLIPLYGEISKEFNRGVVEVALGSTFFSIFYACGLLLFGPVSDRVGRKTIVSAGLLISTISTSLLSFSENLTMLYIFRGLQGFSLATFAPVAFAYCFEIFCERQRTFWIALINAGFLVAGIVGQLLSNMLSTAVNWKFVYIIYALIYIILFIFALVILPRTNIAKNKLALRETIIQMLKLFKNKNLLYCYLIVPTLLFSFVTFYETFSYRFINEDIYFFRIIGLTGVILSIFTKKIIDNYSLKNTFIFSICLGLISTLLLFIRSSLVWISIISILLVAAISLLIPTIIHLIGTYSGNERGKALSLYSFLLLLGASAGPVIAAIFPYTFVLFILLSIFIINGIITIQLRL